MNEKGQRTRYDNRESYVTNLNARIESKYNWLIRSKRIIRRI